MKDTGYKAFRKEHAIGHVYGTLAMAVMCLLIAGFVVYF
jgi:hypothetical protein